MVSMLIRYPQALSSTLTLLGTLQPRAFRSLNRVETLDSTSNCYLERYKKEEGTQKAKTLKQSVYIKCVQSYNVYLLIFY